ncbi:MAG: FAD-dependent oxidoreductase [Acidobacteriota bacterium]|nr:FAD-dependent oxidoreductase [Acidobacteriota bacterium]
MIIAGAGIVGLSSAWRLRGCGIPVTVFDAGAVGSEASWSGAGMLAPGGEMEEASPLTEMAMRGLQLYPQFVAELRGESGLPVDYRQCGAMEVALTDEDAEVLERRAARQARLGIHSESAVFPGSVSARFFPDDALVNPRDVVAALRLMCARRGVRILEHERVLEIRPDGSGVRTSKGVYEDEGALICAGAWSSELAGARAPESMPVRGHLISYAADPGRLQTILRHGHTYLLQRETGSLIAGSSTEYAGFDRTIDESVVASVHSRATRLLPYLRGLRPSDRWIGFRPGIAGGQPAIGRIDNTKIWTAYGHYRNGILLAPDTARRIAESVASVL